ncbi:MAG TPA: dihydrodipicolinate reductase C-terminal domain-containing protein [Candidatus Dormibacteraeota bacterium]|nr:dihydrodipicolinate reductase C-terminal domain-containing protein [Candidatus Dormibacteraeota bacterium]
METIVFGDGGMGRAIRDALLAQGEPDPLVLGRPAGGTHHPGTLPAADVAFEASQAAAVADNLATALTAGTRRFVIATTGWDSDRPLVRRLLVQSGAAAIAAPNLSLGVALFGRLVDAAVDLFGPLEGFDPYIIEWHRRTKADRPSGTARELARRILERHPRKRRLADTDHQGPPDPDVLDVAVLRAGASPGMHVVGFDAIGETLELRLTARDRSAYAAGALAAAAWLMAEPRAAGIQSFDAVVDELLLSGAGRVAEGGRTARGSSRGRGPADERAVEEPADAEGGAAA